MCAVYFVNAQTKFRKTTEQFKNHEFVWEVMKNDTERVGEFWPIHALNLVTKKTDPEVFAGDISNLQKKLGSVATTPDGMTGGSFGTYEMQGKALSHGRPCGDGFVYDYGIVLVSMNGYKIMFTHTREFPVFDSLYTMAKEAEATLFFLPSLYRNGLYVSSNKKVDKVLIRRQTFVKGKFDEQVGVVLFDSPTTYDDARTTILGLDRQDKSKTTHIYVLDGGSAWGQSCKEVNDTTKVVGNRNPDVVTNYLVFY